MKAGNLDEAERLYELARRDDPYHTKWIANLARVHLRQKDNAKFLGDLAMIADNDADDLDVRKALAEQPPRRRPARAGREVGDRVPLHRRLRPGLPRPPGRRPGRPARSTTAPIEEYQAALDLKAKKPNDLKVRLAKAQLGLGQRDAARATLDGVLKADPDHPEAKALREEIGKSE